MFQTRSEGTGLMFHAGFDDAVRHASLDPTVWKISFKNPKSGKRFRLVKTREETVWEQDPGHPADAFEAPRLWTEKELQLMLLLIR